MGIEETCIKKIEDGIRAIRMGTKSPRDANVGFSLNRLKELNIGLYKDYLASYKRVLEHHKKFGSNK
jgi:hypothetical protein